MLGLFENVINRFREIWAGMTLNQKVISGTAIAAIVLVAVFLTTLSGNFVNYSVLFAELDSRSASEIVARLEQQNIPYRLTGEGTVIEVPVEQVDRLKIDLVAAGLPQSGIVGYEILDTTNFGLSDFREKKNYKRALEGELTKTLRAFSEIQDAHVLLNFPEPTLFTENEEKPTASVTLKLRTNRTLPKRSVQTITDIIGSATGINPNDVSVADMRSGELLTAPVTDEMAMLSSTQMEMKVKTDQYLANKVKSILDGAFGAGIALVTVNSELAFDRIERTSTAYDQDRSGILSEQRRETTNPTADGGGEEETVTNYEVGKTVENFISSPGSISRLTVSVMMDAKDSVRVGDNDERQVVKVPWTAEELNRIRSICETAVGYNSNRGDRVEIVSLSFGTREYEAEEARLTMRATLIDGVRALGSGIAVIVAIVLFFVILRQIARSLDPSKMTLQIDSLLEREKRDLREEEEEVETEKATLIRKIIAKASQDPETTAKTIRTIYREGA
jgi:flagellar M-ring protein FliF